MDALRSYLITAMLASVVSALCIQFTDERFRKYVKFLAALGLLLILTRPLLSLVSGISDFSVKIDADRSDVQTNESAYLELWGSQLSDSVGDRVAMLFQLPREAIYVSLTLNTADPTAIEFQAIDITVTVECDEEAIEDRLKNEFYCTVNVREELEGEGTD